jgi:natural product biosynthesis luciferase-like monooxygenase protein
MQPQPKSALFIGEGALLARCADLFLQAGHAVTGIVSSESRVTSWAREHGIPVLASDSELGALLSEREFDYLFSIVNMTILTPDIIRLPKRLAINFHDGPLPRYAGAHATSWSLMNGEHVHGVTWHEMTDRVDAGRILKQRLFGISKGETAWSLNAKCFEEGAESFRSLLTDLAKGDLCGHTQASSERTWYPLHKRPYAHGLIEFESAAASIEALVNALTFGAAPNPLCLPKVLIDDEPIVVARARTMESTPMTRPGEVVAIGDDRIRIATATSDIELQGLSTVQGQPVSLARLRARSALGVGDRLQSPSADRLAALSALAEAVAPHERYWVARLQNLEPIDLSSLSHPREGQNVADPKREGAHGLPLNGQLCIRVRDAVGFASAADAVAAAFAIYLSRLTGRSQFDIGLRSAPGKDRVSSFESFFASTLPVRMALDVLAPSSVALRLAHKLIREAGARGTYARDVLLRYPDLRAPVVAEGAARLPVCVDEVRPGETWIPAPACHVALVSEPETDSFSLACAEAFDNRLLADIHEQFSRFLHAVATSPERPLVEMPILSDAQRTRILIDWNETARVDVPATLAHAEIDARATATPEREALIFKDQTLTYGALGARSNQLAAYLQRLGVGPETLVGVLTHRSPDMIVALLGILKAGGAYVPLDPTYPDDRLNFMIADAGIRVVVTEESLLNRVMLDGRTTVCLDRDRERLSRERALPVGSPAQPDNLAYVIYTSGSTGTPKGVMVRHRNVTAFFAGMDEQIGVAEGDVWLAVTSLSFDISVLELLWTLSRGLKVVLQADVHDLSDGRPPQTRRAMDVSLFYFASDESGPATDQYRLLLESAQYADRHGFAAVWTPERHFHAFGGLYPNPAVTSAAIAIATERIGIRAGSLVLPLHHPARVAEDWAVIDNLSGGRVGISFAAGWQPNDFVLAPDRFADRKGHLVRDVETVRRLWRGESVPLRGPGGSDVEVRTLPRPCQPELPIWLTAASNPETYELAGAIGANVLTHLLGQRVGDLAANIERYVAARQAHGHDGNGHVTLMLHTFVGDDDDQVREIVREPMKAYLRSSVDLIRQASWTFPTFASMSERTGKSPDELFDGGVLNDEESEALLEHAFERYFKTSGLLGSLETCLAQVDRLKSIGVSEIACLIDFGVDSALVLKHLDQLNALRQQVSAAPDSSTADYSIAGQIERHGVTHLQCTPSMASLLVMDERVRQALGNLRHWMIGGEQLPTALAERIEAVTPARILNMYGPTETTVWSSVHQLRSERGAVPIGRPIANTRFYVVDAHLQPVPVGVPGELLIGGEGVARGYLHRPALTERRFIPDPFVDQPGALVYRTGDLVRYRPDGVVEFLGRLDHQVKVRGHRIELGEIEARIAEQPGVQATVVVAREEGPSDLRLVAYVVLNRGEARSVAQVRASLEAALPSVMVPSHIVMLDALPQTPNGKIDRAALPRPEQSGASTQVSIHSLDNDVERTIVTVWQDILGVSPIGVDDNFFEIGGHSLLVFQVAHVLNEKLRWEIPVTDLFRFPTARSLADRLSQTTQDDVSLVESQDRAQNRRALMAQRRHVRRPAALA